MSALGLELFIAYYQCMRASVTQSGFSQYYDFMKVPIFTVDAKNSRISPTSKFW